MPVIPTRDVGSVGIIKDVAPQVLPPNAWSDGINVRFNGKKVERAAAFRTFAGTITPTTPVFTWGLYNQGSFDSLLYVNNDGRVYQYANGAETNFTEVGHVNNVDTRPYTGCILSSCNYLNRPDIAPRVLTPAAVAFVSLANWPAGYTCLALRAFKSQLIALNMTEGGINFPLRVRTSDAALARSVPASWDATDTTKIATTNELSQARTPIVDGGALGDVFVIYTRDECWKMLQVGGTFIYDFVRLPFDNAGLINQNCWTEIDVNGTGRHIAWSDTDIYMHDGVGKQSIIDQRNRETFFGELNMSKSGVFFVAHDKPHNEVLFCCVSGNSDTQVKGSAYCNYAAVWNYKTDTWSFRDLPNASSATTANANAVYTYTTVPAGLTYSNIGGSYLDQEDSFSRFAMFSLVQDTTNGISVSKIDVLDFADTGRLALPIDADSAANPHAFVERIGYDLDAQGADLRAYKQVRAVMPILNITSPSASMNIWVGKQDLTGQVTNYNAGATGFNPRTMYKVDTRVGGRFIALIFAMPTVNDFTFSGFDLDVILTGRR